MKNRKNAWKIRAEIVISISYLFRVYGKTRETAKISIVNRRENVEFRVVRNVGAALSDIRGTHCHRTIQVHRANELGK